MHEKKGKKNLCENAGVPSVGWGDMFTCAALGNSGLVTAGCTAGAAGRLGSAPAAGAGAMCGIPGRGTMWGGIPKYTAKWIIRITVFNNIINSDFCETVCSTASNPLRLRERTAAVFFLKVVLI